MTLRRNGETLLMLEDNDERIAAYSMHHKLRITD